MGDQAVLTSSTSRQEEDYAAAKRAAAEAVDVARETLETTERQKEQLENARNMADETEYKLDKATRLLRGMTWTGWIANKFSNDVEPPAMRSRRGERNLQHVHVPKAYDDTPKECEPLALAIQNYHANLCVLESCETEDQKLSLLSICDNMYRKASKELKGDFGDKIEFRSNLERDLAVLREHQFRIQGKENANETPRKNEALMAGISQTSSPNKEVLDGGGIPKGDGSPDIDPDILHQDAHLDFMQGHLTELRAIASNLGNSIAGQNEILGSLDGKNDDLLYKSKGVTRRADNLIQKKSWTNPKKEFVHKCSIREVSSGLYLAVSAADYNLHLVDKYDEKCLFGYWKKKNIFGLQSIYSRRWIGQSLFGHLVCSAYNFGGREEWDIDGNLSETPLLCASAGWGRGEYLLVTKPEQKPVLGCGGASDKGSAAVWCIAQVE